MVFSCLTMHASVQNRSSREMGSFIYSFLSERNLTVGALAPDAVSTRMVVAIVVVVVDSPVDSPVVVDGVAFNITSRPISLFSIISSSLVLNLRTLQSKRDLLSPHSATLRTSPFFLRSLFSCRPPGQHSTFDDCYLSPNRPSRLLASPIPPRSKLGCFFALCRVNTCCETVGSRFPHLLEPAPAAGTAAAAPAAAAAAPAAGTPLAVAT